MAIIVGNKKEKAQRVPIEFSFTRDDEQEWFKGQAVLSLDAAGMRRTLAAANSESADMLDALFFTVGKMMDNTDGVPAHWKPRVTYKGRDGAWTEDPQFADEDAEPFFRVPIGEHKGEHWPMSKVGEFTAPEAGSTRARWHYLINEDEGAIVDAGDVTKLFEQMVGAAAKRPTAASS